MLDYPNSFEYDPRGNLIKSVDPLGNVSTATYDANGRKSSSTDANGQITRYEYNAQGQVVKTIDAAGFVTIFAYGGSGCPSCGGGVDKLTALTDAREETSAFAYDPLGRLSSETDPLGHVTSYTYDPQEKKGDAHKNINILIVELMVGVFRGHSLVDSHPFGCYGTILRR